MSRKKIAIFGYGKHGKFLVRGLHKDGFDITIIESNKGFYKDAKGDGFEDVYLLDVTKDSELTGKIDFAQYSQLVCVMDDEHLNVFLTLSLSSIYKDSYILAISDSVNVTKKLKMAGASKVIDLYSVSANKIYNILDKPVATRLLEEFVLNRKGITFKEIVIPEGSFLDKMMVDDVDFGKYGVLFIGMIDEEKTHSFVFVTAGLEHKLDAGDTIVCLGEKEHLNAFARLVKKGKSDISSGDER